MTSPLCPRDKTPALHLLAESPCQKRRKRLPMAHGRMTGTIPLSYGVRLPGSSMTPTETFSTLATPIANAGRGIDQANLTSYFERQSHECWGSALECTKGWDTNLPVLLYAFLQRLWLAVVSSLSRPAGTLFTWVLLCVVSRVLSRRPSWSSGLTFQRRRRAHTPCLVREHEKDPLGLHGSTLAVHEGVPAVFLARSVECSLASRPRRNVKAERGVPSLSRSAALAVRAVWSRVQSRTSGLSQRGD